MPVLRKIVGICYLSLQILRLNLEKDKNTDLKINFEKLKQKAEQIRKKSEIKITNFESKKEKELELQKRNNPNFRDYDENPLIIKCYDEIFWFLGNPIFVFMFGFYLMSLFQGLHNGDLTSNMKAFVFINFVPIFFVVFTFVKHKFYFSNYKIKFTNMFIEFIHNDEVKFSTRIIKKELEKPFLAFTRGKNLFEKLTAYALDFFVLFVIVIVSISRDEYFYCFLPLFIYLANFLFKFILYLSINLNLKGFKFFPCIRVCEQNIGGRYYRKGDIYGAHLIYLYNDEVYKEVKKYFLQRDINIDNLPIRYFQMFA